VVALRAGKTLAAGGTGCAGCARGTGHSGRAVRAAHTVRAVGAVLALGNLFSGAGLRVRIQPVGVGAAGVEFFAGAVDSIPVACGDIAQPLRLGRLGIGLRRGGTGLGVGLFGDDGTLLDPLMLLVHLGADAFGFDVTPLVALLEGHHHHGDDQ
jgi:hypothetical protein